MYNGRERLCDLKGTTKMKELVKEREMHFPVDFNVTGRLKAAAGHMAAVISGFLSAGAVMLGGMSPLGTALVAGLPLKYVPAASLGTLSGYIFPLFGKGGLKYIAALLAVTVIRLLLSGTRKIQLTAVMSAIIAGAVLTGVNVASAGGDVLGKGAVGLAEGMMAGGCAYFLNRSSEILSKRHNGLTDEQTASLLISANLALTALYNVGADGISSGVIASIVFILLAARYGRSGMAAVCSVSAATAAFLSGCKIEAALLLCISGLAAGVMSGIGKIAAACAPAAVSAVYVLSTAAAPNASAMLIESVAGGVVSLLIPRTVCAKVGSLLSPVVRTPDTDGLRRTLTMRLGLASSALHGVTGTVDDVAKCLGTFNKHDMSEVLSEVENDACRGCRFSLYCWEKQRDTTTAAVLGMSDAIRRHRPVGMADVPAEFSENCLRPEQFENAVTRYYSDYLSSLAAEKRISEMREIMSDQMNGIADMLSELSDEFKTAQSYDTALAARLAKSLSAVDVHADECCCFSDKYGRMTVELRILTAPEIPLSRSKLLERIEDTCERDFEPPMINRCGKGYYITATEKAVYSVDAHVTQFNQGKNQHCGDTCRWFFDGRGRMISVISDGMGSGGRAAVDSAMAAALCEKLLTAGFGYDCTLKLLNSAMLYKSTDESLATVDISCFDLHTGRTELLKAGAAPTVVRRSGRTGRAECRSLPVGILHEIGFDRATVTLKEGDVLLMMSDGVCTDGTDWICAELEAFKDGSAKQLSEQIATAARRRRHDGHEDDITVFAAVIEKAV